MGKLAIAMGYRDVADSPRFKPYIPGQASRRSIHDWVYGEYRKEFPDAPVYEADSCSVRFNRAEARNSAVNAAFHHADVVLIVDADVTFHAASISGALRTMERHPYQVKWATPYTEYVKANRRATALILKGMDPYLIRERDFGWRTHTGTAGLMLITREAWETIGGYDESFTHWGWEDWAIVVALETLVHGVTRSTGTCIHLEHDQDRDRRRQKIRMQPLYEPYRQAHGDPEAMRALLTERGVRA